MELQLPHPHRSGHSLGRAGWALRVSELKMPFCLVRGWFYKIKAICLIQETVLVILKVILIVGFLATGPPGRSLRWIFIAGTVDKGFPGGSAGKESACSAGDPGSVPGLGRTPGEGTGYPLQYAWVSLVAQTAKNLLAMRETWVQSLSWDDPLEEGMKTHSCILAWRILMDRGAWWAIVHGVAESWT